MRIDPLKIFQSLVKSDPAAKSIQMILLMVSGLAIASKFQLDYETMFIGLVVTVALTYVAHVVKNPNDQPKIALFICWSIAIIFIASLLLLFTSFYFGVPIDFNGAMIVS